MGSSRLVATRRSDCELVADTRKPACHARNGWPSLRVMLQPSAQWCGFDTLKIALSRVVTIQVNVIFKYGRNRAHRTYYYMAQK